MPYRSLIVLPVMVLAACGGGSTGPSTPAIEPLSPSGFASDTVTPQSISTLNLTDQTRIVSQGGEELSLAVQDITLDDFNDRDGELIVTIDGQTFTVVVDPDDSDLLLFEDENAFVSVRFLINDFPDAQVVSVFAIIEDELNASNIAIGLDTNPTVIDARSGGAEFEGGLAVTTRTGFTDGFGAGRIELDVDFDTMTLDGDLIVFDDGGDNPEVRVPSVAFDIDETDITGNGFETTLTYDAASSLDKIDGTIVSTGLTGRFFGTEGSTIGGQLFGEIDNGPEAFPTLIEGAYVAAE